MKATAADRDPKKPANKVFARGYEANPKFVAHFIEFVTYGYGPDDLAEGIDLRGLGRELAPLVKRGLTEACWASENAELDVQWMAYFKEVPKPILRWSAARIRRYHEVQRDYPVQAAAVFARVGDVPALLNCMKLNRKDARMILDILRSAV